MASVISNANEQQDEPSANGSRAADSAARRIWLNGGVQGLGVRPAIFRLATELGLGGNVRNSSGGVEIEIEGRDDLVREFECQLLGALPRAALVSHLKSESIAPSGLRAFSIIKQPPAKTLRAHVPQDRGLCEECEREIATNGERRRGYPFTSCTQCGPRYTVIRAMPFERTDTAMDKFPLCDDCRREYERPGDRRFHAQTTACPECGPQVKYKTSNNESSLLGGEALQAAVDSLRSGNILALKGLGGYQLLADATNPVAVERLRGRKGRLAKPLAVMVASEAAAAKLGHFDAYELTAFRDFAAPIVLARIRSETKLAPGIAPHLDTVGVMRPTTPLHALLAQGIARPLVCTSANCEGAPLDYIVEAAERNLNEISDAWLHHDREIVRPIDDSVVRTIADRRVTIRLARGLAPLPLELPNLPATLALGGHMKCAIAWSNGSQSVLGPHIGDLESLPSRERYLAHIKDMLRLYQYRPTLLVHDLHPDYFSTQWAARQRVPRLAVQHHHAHVAAAMLEHGWLDRRVLGVAWDGTGYGTDGTIWGGEFLMCEGADFERVGRIRPFGLPGGEAAIREPWRTAVNLCSQLGTQSSIPHHPAWSVSAIQKKHVLNVAKRPNLSTTTSSAGRLIDAAAALILGIGQVTYEGEAAMRLEAAADRGTRGWYHFPVEDDELMELDWRPLFAGLLDDIHCGADPAIMAMKFHRSLAHGIVGVCRRYSELPVVLCGGVFQNKLLTELIAEMQSGSSELLGLPGVIPPNDGGLAAGQLAIAAAKRKV